MGWQSESLFHSRLPPKTAVISDGPTVVRAFAGKTVLIVGDLILDEYTWGKGWRISPEAPVPVVEFESRTFRLGGAGNVAANVLSLGGRPRLASAVGDDPQGQQTPSSDALPQNLQ